MVTQSIEHSNPEFLKARARRAHTEGQCGECFERDDLKTSREP